MLRTIIFFFCFGIRSFATPAVVPPAKDPLKCPAIHSALVSQFEVKLRPIAERFKAVGIDLVPQFHSIDGNQYATVKGNEATKLGLLAKELQRRGMDLAVSVDWNNLHGENGSIEALRGLLFVSNKTFEKGEPDASTEAAFVKILQDWRDSRSNDIKAIETAGLKYKITDSSDGKDVLRLVPDNTTGVGRLVAEMNALGVEVRVDTYNLSRKGAVGVFEREAKPPTLTVSASSVARGEVGGVVEHEADHARLDGLLRQGVDSVFHGRILPTIGSQLTDVPPLYRFGFGIDEARGYAKIYALRCSELISHIPELAKTTDGQKTLVAELQRLKGLHEESQQLNLKVYRMFVLAARGVRGETLETPKPTAPPPKPSLFSRLFGTTAPAEPIRPELLVRSITFDNQYGGGRDKKASKAEFETVGGTAIEIPLLDPRVSIPNHSPISYSTRIEKPGDEAFMLAADKRFTRGALIHRKSLEALLAVEAVTEALIRNPSDPKAQRDYVESVKALEATVLSLNEKPE